MDKRLLDILCCPLTKAPLRPLDETELAALNLTIAGGSVHKRDGGAVTQALSAGLITRDGHTIYRLDDDIPVMLADESIATAQLPDFPCA